MLALRTLNGANYWSRFPVTRLDLAVGAYDEIPSDSVPGMVEALQSALPGLIEHRCSVGERGGFLTRVRRGTYVPHIVEHVALELQGVVGHDVGYGRARGGDRDGEYTIVFHHRHAGVGRRAGELAVGLTQRAFAGTLDAAAVASAIADLQAAADEPTEVELETRVVCGAIGTVDRSAFRTALLARRSLAKEDVVAVSPASVLESGLPYAESRLAVVLDVEPDDVPTRYREREAALRLASVIADGAPRDGVVIVPAHEKALQTLIRETGRRTATFGGNGAFQAQPRTVDPLATLRRGRIVVGYGERVVDFGGLSADAPVNAQLAAALADFLIGEHGD